MNSAPGQSVPSYLRLLASSAGLSHLLLNEEAIARHRAVAVADSASRGKAHHRPAGRAGFSSPSRLAEKLDAQLRGLVGFLPEGWPGTSHRGRQTRCHPGGQPETAHAQYQLRMAKIRCDAGQCARLVAVRLADPVTRKALSPGNRDDDSRLAMRTPLSESIVINMIKYAYEMQENDRWPQAWASRVAGDAATSNQGDP